MAKEYKDIDESERIYTSMVKNPLVKKLEDDLKNISDEVINIQRVENEQIRYYAKFKIDLLDFIKEIEKDIFKRKITFNEGKKKIEDYLLK